MRDSERLLKKLREETDLDIPEGATLVRLYASRASVNIGAWSWTAADANGIPLHRDSRGRPMAIGSQYTMSELLRQGIQVNSARNGDLCIDVPDVHLPRQRPGASEAAPGEGHR